MISVDNLLAAGAVLGAVAVIGGAVLAVFKGCRWVWRLGRRTGHFLDDWNGEAPRDGAPGHPGAMARLASVEKELKPNGGSTLKDAVSRLEAGLQAVAGQVASVADQATENARLTAGVADQVSTLDQRVAVVESATGPHVARRNRLLR